jgi:aspartyl-tRNA(Asn)/glutamyl-tRNA(Gln) amidotransferase subunit A
VFRDLGAELVDVELPAMADFNACGSLLYAAEAYGIHEADLRAAPHLYGQRARLRILVGAMVSAADYYHALRRRMELTKETLARMATAGVDALVMPTLFGTAPIFADVGIYSILERAGLTVPFNVTGQPALSVCAGYDPAGLPIGMQIVGRPFADDVVLAMGDAYERATPWRDRRPPI